MPNQNAPQVSEIVIVSEPDTLSIDPDWVYSTWIDVTVTIYHAVEGQTDDTPHITADGTWIDVRNAGDYRYCALSRDLLSRWGGIYSYGDMVYVQDAGHFSGFWIVKDTMHQRWKNRVDLLVDQDSGLHKFEYAKLRSL